MSCAFLIFLKNLIPPTLSIEKFSLLSNSLLAKSDIFVMPSIIHKTSVEGFGIAVVATFLRLYDFPMPPLILAFVLGGLMEENLRRSLLISDGSWNFLWDRPLTLCIMITILLIIIWQTYNSYKSINR